MKRKLQNEFSMKIMSKSENERFSRTSVCAFITALDPTIPELADIRTALSEAVTNAIVHGYRNAEGTIYISVKYYTDRTVVLKIKDRGCGIEDIEKCKEPLYTTDESGERGGMGFAIMESFMDKMTVKSKVGSGTTVTLYKKLS
ncbi:MAG: anti-sigma F factor [Ruminococcaceae bacterium]|nr:anti-sigma F factor [Oscillospiraceae bacterium]